MKRMNESHEPITCIHTPYKHNMLASNLVWQKPILQDNSLPIVAKRFLPITNKLPAKSIFHSSYLRWTKQKDVANIITIHDLAPEQGLISGKGKRIRQWQQRKALEHADGVICVSETIRKDVLDYYHFLLPEKVIAIHHGVSEAFTPMPIKQQEHPYILFVGHRSGYKNFNLAVEIVAAMPDIKFVTVGGKHLSNQEQTLLDNKLSNRYTFKSVVEISELNRLYNNAFCLLYPSSYEGFGLPIIEAMKVGCPVVTTNKSAIPEVAGNGALLIDDFEVSSFIRALESLYDKTQKQALIERGKIQASKYSWAKCFNTTIDFYKQIHQGKL
jgi:mannosyltransferase